MNDQDRRRRRALIVFRLAIYGFLLAMFLIQIHMYLTRDWSVDHEHARIRPAPRQTESPRARPVRL